jgi:hypothetical protein
MLAEIPVFGRTGVFVSMNAGSASSRPDHCNARPPAAVSVLARSPLSG